MPDVNAELFRLRDRYHKLNGAVQGLGWKLRALEDKLPDLERRQRELADELEAMMQADKIAGAVTAALSEERKHRFTRWHKLAASIGALVLATPAVHDLWGWLSG